MNESIDQEAAARYNQPRGLPYRAVLNEDLSFTIVAAGHEQVARYDKAKSFVEYVDGEERAQ